MTPLHDWNSWEPLVDALRDSAPPGARVSEFEGTVGPRSWGGRYSDDGEEEPRRAFHRALAREAVSAARAGRTVKGPRERLDAALAALSPLVRPPGVPVHIVAGPNPEDDVVHVIDLPPHVTRGHSAPVEDVVLVPGALPAAYRARLAPTTGARSAPSADPAAVARLVREKNPWVAGATQDQLTAAESALGVPLPEEVRALYAAAGSGELVLASGDHDDHFYGFEIIPLDDGVLRTAFLPEHRFSSWALDGGTLAPEDPAGRVQAAVGSPLWFPVGHDWGGNVYAVDLAPGPEGYLGQVVFLDHEERAGAHIVGDSLTDVLVHRRTVRDARSVTDAPGPAQARRAGAGQAGPGRHAATGADGTSDPAGPEYLALDPTGWRELLDAGTVPRTLLAAGFTNHAPLEETIDVANRLLALHGLEGITVTTITRPPKKTLLSRLLGG